MPACKTPACEVTAASTSDSFAAFLTPGPARKNRAKSRKEHPQTANCLHEITFNVAFEITLGRGTHAAIRANGNVFRLAPQTDQQLTKSEGQP
jgi:hypothetical protein